MRRTWGKLVTAELSKLTPVLLVGCASAPPPEPAPVAPPPPTVVAPPEPPKKTTPDTSDPPGAAPGLGPFVPLAAEGKATEAHAIEDADVVSFGKGVFAYFQLAAPSGFKEPGCLVAGLARKDCRFLRFAPWKAAKDQGAWLRPSNDGAIGAWSDLVPAKHDWGSLGASKDFVYGVRRDEALTIDRIDERGNVTTLFEAPEGTPSLNEVRLVEIGTGLVALGNDGDGPGLQQVFLAKGPDGKLKYHAPVRLDVVLIGSEGVAEQARWLHNSKLKVGYGSWSAVPTIDAKGNLDKSWVLAWTEVIPPKKYTPRGAPVKRGAKNGCGGRPSRPLSDPSVEKKTHLTLYSSEGRAVSDKVVTIPAPPEGRAPELTLVPVAGGYELNGVAFDSALRPTGKPGTPLPAAAITAPPVPGLVSQKLDMAAYDARGGEGLVLYSEKDHQLAQRFSAIGAPMGAPIEIANKLQLGNRSRGGLVHAGESWVALEASGDGVVLVTGPHAGKRVGVVSDRSWVLPRGNTFLLPVDDTHVQVVRHTALPKSYLVEIGVGDPSHARALVSSIIDVAAGTSTPWDLLPQWFAGEAVSPRLSQVDAVFRSPDGGLAMVGRESGGTLALIRRAADGAWAAPVKLGEGEGGARGNLLGVHSVFDDNVLEIASSGTTIGTWVNGGLSLALPKDTTAGTARAAGKLVTIDGALGPLLYRGAVALPPTAAEPIALPPSVQDLYPSCPLAFATAARRVVLVCGEAVDAQRPGARVGFHVLRY